MQKKTVLRSVRDGTKFKIFGLENCYKDLILITVSDCGALIHGYHVKKDSNGEEVLTPLGLNYVISAGTEILISE